MFTPHTTQIAPKKGILAVIKMEVYHVPWVQIMKFGAKKLTISTPEVWDRSTLPDCGSKHNKTEWCMNRCTMHAVCCIWVRSRRFGCLVTWFCYHLIAKPGKAPVPLSRIVVRIHANDIACEWGDFFLKNLGFVPGLLLCRTRKIWYDDYLRINANQTQIKHELIRCSEMQ